MAFATKLTAEDVAVIRERRAAGETYEKIAADYPVSTARIYELCNPEKQAAKLEKIKEYNKKKAAEKKAKKLAAAGKEEEKFDDVDLSDIEEDDAAEPEYGDIEGIDDEIVQTDDEIVDDEELEDELEGELS